MVVSSQLELWSKMFVQFCLPVVCLQLNFSPTVKRFGGVGNAAELVLKLKQKLLSTCVLYLAAGFYWRCKDGCW